MAVLDNLIAGAWRPSLTGQTYVKRPPSAPDRVLAEVPAAGHEDVAAAVEAAVEAFPAWRRTPAAKRGEALAATAELVRSRAEEIARTVSLETGKPLTESRGELVRGASILRFYAGEGRRATGERFEQGSGGAVYTQRRPLGAVALITPWNFPVAIPLWKLAPALAYGNTAVLKLASDAPLTGLALARCFADAGLPDGVLNVITGSGSVCGSALVESEGIAALSFTGSVEVGRELRVLTAERGVHAQLELGGHSPLIVTADADLEAAVEGAFRGAYASQGQKCTATRRMYVDDSVYVTFRDRLLARIESAKLGDPLQPGTEIGPLVNESQLRTVLAAIERSRREGGRLLAGGVHRPEHGHLVEPALFEGLGDEAFVSREEVFGPVAALYRFADLDEAIRRANATRFGLSAAIYTRDLSSARRFAAELDAGVLHVNSPTAGADPHVPFGGLKGSGWGPHEQGRAALEFFTDSVTVYEDA